MTSFVKVVLLICATACCNQPLVTGSPLAASTGNKIRPVQGKRSQHAVKLDQIVFCSKRIGDHWFRFPEGGNFTHRCDLYECRNGQVIEDIHQCDNPLSEDERDLCTQWSDDGCCCDAIGCMDINGEVKKSGELYKKSPSPDTDRPECCYCQPGPITLCLEPWRTDPECTEILPLPSQ